MTFNFKERAQELLTKMAPKFAGLAGEGLYGLVCASILYPVAQAMQQSDAAGQAAIASTLAAMGINVLSNRIQRWQEVSEAADEIAALPPDAEVQPALANAIAEADVQGVIADNLDPIEAERFKRDLRKEMKRLGNWKHYSLKVEHGVGIIGDGNTVVDHNSVVVKRDGRVGDIITGNGRKTVVVNKPDKSKPALRRYLHWLQTQCEDLPLAAMGGHKGRGKEITLSDVYQELDTERDAQDVRTRSAEPAEPGSAITWRKGVEPRKLKAMDAARQYRYLALLGGPGSGKSAFVNSLASGLASILGAKKGTTTTSGKSDARKAAAFAQEFGLPVRLLVREMAPQLAKLKLPWDVPEKCRDKLAALVRDCWKAVLAGSDCDAKDAWPQIEAGLRDGAATMIFDGLDEVPLTIRQRARQAISAAIAAYPDARCIVTCRVRSYPSAPLDGFEAIALAGLSESKIKAFVGAFYQAQVKHGGLSDVGKSIAELENAALGRLRALSSNPLLLTVMAIVHRTKLTLPTERVKLFDQAIDVLLVDWQKHKPGLVIPPSVRQFVENEELRRKVLEKIAYDTHAAQSKAHDPEAALSRAEILQWLEKGEYLGASASAFLDYVDQTSGLLIGNGGGEASNDPPATYGFPHRQFQEHLAGRFMIQGSPMRRRRTYLERADEGDFWSEPAQLGAETLKYSATEDSRLSDLILSLAPEQSPQTTAEWRATFWASRMAALAGKDTVLRDAEEVGQPGFWDQRLIPRVLALLNNDKLPGIERAEAGNLLAEFGDPRFDPDFYHLPFDHERRLCGFVKIPPGPFIMGAVDEADAQPYEVDLPSFYVSRWPVTWAQYRRFAEDFNHQMTGMWIEPREYDGPDNHPIWGVNWYDAIAYCEWLDARLREDPNTPSALLEILNKGCSVTLPTEEQWEKAAKGDSNAAHPWGDMSDPNRANYDASGIGHTSAVGCFPGIEGRYSYGCDDMLGNVWEWTLSLYRTYPPAEHNGVGQPGGGTYRAVRGGSYYFGAQSVRCAARFDGQPLDRNNRVGFRAAISRSRAEDS